MSGTTMAFLIVLIVIGGSTIAKAAHSIGNALSQRQANRQISQDMTGAIAQLQKDIDEIKATLADLVISLHDREMEI